MFDELVKLIPGFGAYKDEESRRKDDRLTREFVAKRIGECKSHLDSLGQLAVSKGDLETPLRIEKMRSRLDTAQSRLKAAVEGYAGWFSERTVDEKLLKQVAEHDANLVSLVDQIEELIKSSQWQELEEAINLLHSRIDRRKELLVGQA